MTSIRSLLSSAASRVAETAQSVSETAKSVADKATTVADNLKTGPSSPELEHDRWEQADPSQGLFQKVAGLAKTVKAEAEAVQDAMIGAAKSKVGQEVARAAEWIEPTVQAVNEVKEIRHQVQDRIEEELQRFDPNVLHDTISTTKELAGPLIFQAATDALGLPIKIASTTADMENRLLNAVGDAAAHILLEQREAVLAVGGGIRDIAHLLSDPASSLDDPGLIEQALLESIVPRQNMAFTLGVWMLDSIGTAVESSIDLAEHFQNSVGLPTKDNFPEWIDEIEPGSTREMSGKIGLDFAAGAGAKAELGLGFSVDRSQDNPHIFTLTLATEGLLGAKAGATTLGKGAAITGALEGEAATQFTFDTRNQKEMDLFCDLVLAQQKGLPLGQLGFTAREFITGALFENGLSAEAELNHTTKFNGHASIKQLAEIQRGDDGEQILRKGIKLRGELSKGQSLLGTASPGLISELLATDAVEGSETTAKIIDALTGGHLGNSISGAIEATLGAEYQNDELDHLFVEITADGKFFGHEGEINLQLTLHEPQHLAQFAGLSTQRLAAQIAAGEFDLGRLLETISAQGHELTDFVGVNLSASQTSRTGLDLNIEPIRLQDQMVRTESVDLLSLGRAATNKGESTQHARQDAQLRQLDRQIHC